jgi:hypothetical protein
MIVRLQRSRPIYVALTALTAYGCIPHGASSSAPVVRPCSSTVSDNFTTRRIGNDAGTYSAVHPEGNDTAPPDAAPDQAASTGERLDREVLRPNRANPPVEPLDPDDCLSLASARRRAADEQFVCNPVDSACFAVARSICEKGKGRRA